MGPEPAWGKVASPDRRPALFGSDCAPSGERVPIMIKERTVPALRRGRTTSPTLTRRCAGSSEGHDRPAAAALLSYE
jgi:hypothetical protein